MSSVIKNVFMSPEEFNPEDKVIDSNTLVDKKIEEYQSLSAKHKANASVSYDEDGQEIPLEEDDEFDENGLMASIGPSEEDLAQANADIEEMLNAARSQADAIISDANDQAQNIISQAKDSIETMRTQAIEEGKKQGYDLGVAMGQNEMEEAKADLEAEKGRLQEEFNKKLEGMEYQLVDTICDVIEKVFMIEYSDKKDIIIHLCDNAISNIESSKEFQIKINEKSYDFLQNNKAQIEEKVGSDVQLDIVLDPLLDDGQCIIETDGGVFDCSLGVQLNNLLKDVRALSI